MSVNTISHWPKNYKRGGLLVRIDHAPDLLGTGVWLIEDKADGLFILRMKENGWERDRFADAAEAAGFLLPKPSFIVPRDLATEFMVGMSSACSEALGNKHPGQDFADGKLEAMAVHLEDMRKIAFAPGIVEHGLLRNAPKDGEAPRPPRDFAGDLVDMMKEECAIMRDRVSRAERARIMSQDAATHESRRADAAEAGIAGLKARANEQAAEINRLKAAAQDAIVRAARAERLLKESRRRKK